MKGSKQTTPAQPPGAVRAWLLLPALVIVTLAIYQPAWHGGLVWDDEGHLTPVELRSADGLPRIWTEIGATQQYYPVVHTAFWALHRLAGDDTLPYHLLSIVLHALSAWLAFLILRRLQIPGALLAAVVFAVHPVHVESVAWISELKNTLSGALYLGAALTYVAFDERRTKRLYAIATSLFVLALLSKTVTATLPAGLLVILWWRRGRLEWRRDVLPLLPWLALGLGAALLTSWVERTFIGARGETFALSPIERVLLAGRALWFYLGSLVWPARLAFVYPRWSISATVWWHYLYPAGMLALLAVLWIRRTRSRAPLAALLFFAATVSPALGFVSVYPFRYSWVADHFQYLASLGIIALAAAGAATFVQRRMPRAYGALVVVLALPLAMVTTSQARNYVDAETLYRATLERNPDCWMCHNNLGMLKLHGSAEELRSATGHIQAALGLNHDNHEAHNNLGVAWQRLGRFEDASAAHREAVRLAPEFSDAHYNLGIDLQALGRFDEAVAAYLDAIRLRPNYVEAHHNLGATLEAMGRLEEAAGRLREAARLAPDSPQIHSSLGNMLQRMKRPAEAIEEYRTALGLKPDSPETMSNLGLAYLGMDRVPDAIAQFEQALRLLPNAARIHDNLGSALARAGRLEEAIVHFGEALRLDPAYTPARRHVDDAMRILRRAK